MKPCGTAGLRSTIFMETFFLLVERHVELALPALEERYRRAEAILLEVLGVAVRLVAVLIDVLLVEEEQVRVLRVAVSLIKQVARFFP